MKLNDIRDNPGSTKDRIRVGRGIGSGKGKTGGRGVKGQKARSGGSIRLGFEGGQMPLIRRLPKRGFSNAAFKKKIVIVNLSDLAELPADSAINERALRAHGLIRGHFDGIKVLGGGELSKKLTLEADLVSASARENIEAARGTVTIREKAAAASEPA